MGHVGGQPAVKKAVAQAGYLLHQRDAQPCLKTPADTLNEMLRLPVELATKGVPGYQSASLAPGTELAVSGDVNCRIDEDGPVSTRGIFRDVTEQKRLQEVVRLVAVGLTEESSEKFFESLVEHLARTMATDVAFVAEVAPAAPETARQPQAPSPPPPARTATVLNIAASPTALPPHSSLRAISRRPSHKQTSRGPARYARAGSTKLVRLRKMQA